MSNALDRVTAPNIPTPAHLGQATAIEQSRAVAEVHAAIVVAQQCPRDVDQAVRDMHRSCASKAMASRAFFSFPRSGETVSGPSIHLARELARCWGNIQYGVAELRRDDEAGISEMQAFAWDVQTNTRSAHIFIVPHARDTRRGRTNLTDLRDVYENNANNGARRLREAIWSVLPQWFTEEAKERCHETLSSVSGEELQQNIDAAVKAYSRRGVTLQQLEAKVGKTRTEWGGQEFATLDVLFGSLKRGEISIDEAFPAAGVTANQITGGTA